MRRLLGMSNHRAYTGPRGRLTMRRWLNANMVVALSTALTLGVSAIALIVSSQANNRQDSLQRQAERLQQQVDEQQSAPLLIPGVEASKRGQRIVVIAQSGERIPKLADRLLVQGQS